MALGANLGDVRRLVLRPALGAVTLGLAAGLATVLAATRVIDGRLIAPGFDLTSAALAAAVVAATALAATWHPARRAIRVDPATTLRAE